jgi:hypothetical protein
MDTEYPVKPGRSSGKENAKTAVPQLSSSQQEKSRLKFQPTHLSGQPPLEISSASRSFLTSQPIQRNCWCEQKTQCDKVPHGMETDER